MESWKNCVACYSEVQPGQEAMKCNACGRRQHLLCGTFVSRRVYRQGELVLDQGYCQDCTIGGPISVAPNTMLDKGQSPRQSEIPAVPEEIPAVATSLKDNQQMPVDSRPEVPIEESVGEPEVGSVATEPPTCHNFSPPIELSEEEVIATNNVTLEQNSESYELILGGTVKGGDLLADNRGYTYSRSRIRVKGTIWTCSNRGQKCAATVRQIGVDSFKKGSREHNHKGDPEKSIRVKARAMVKTAARNDVNKGAGKLVNEMLQTLPTEIPLPYIRNLERIANRAREIKRLGKGKVLTDAKIVSQEPVLPQKSSVYIICKSESVSG